MTEAEMIERIARAIKDAAPARLECEMLPVDSSILATAAYAEVRAMVEEKDAEIARLRARLEMSMPIYGEHPLRPKPGCVSAKPTLVWTEKGLEER